MTTPQSVSRRSALELYQFDSFQFYPHTEKPETKEEENPTFVQSHALIRWKPKEDQQKPYFPANFGGVGNHGGSSGVVVTSNNQGINDQS